MECLGQLEQEVKVLIWERKNETNYACCKFLLVKWLYPLKTLAFLDSPNVKSKFNTFFFNKSLFQASLSFSSGKSGRGKRNLNIDWMDGIRLKFLIRGGASLKEQKPEPPIPEAHRHNSWATRLQSHLVQTKNPHQINYNNPKHFETGEMKTKKCIFWNYPSFPIRPYHHPRLQFL